MLPSAGACASCHQTASLKCSGCQSVFYCSKEHQREDWPKHKGLCLAYEIKSSPGLGRYLVASRDIKKDELLFREEPLALGPRHTGPLPTSCPGCYRAWYPGEPKDNCPGCDWPVCSKSCSGLTNPDRHGAECQLFKIVKKVMSFCPMEIVLPLRCLLLQTLKPKKWKVLKELTQETVAKNATGKTFRDRRVLFMQFTIHEQISKAASKFIPDCSINTVIHIFDLLEVSGRELFTPFSGPFQGVFPSYCRLVHSCLPNVRICFDLPLEKGDPGNDGWKGRMTARATKDISKGEPLTYGFVNTLLHTLNRQKELKETWNFRCSCDRCLDPHELGLDTGTIRCMECPGFIVPSDPAKIGECDWACDLGCGKTLPTEKVLAFEEVLFMEVGRTRYGTGQEPSTEKLETLVETLEEFLHPNHYLCFIVKNLLAKFYGKEEEGGLAGASNEQLQKKSELCQQSRSYLENPHMPHASTNIAEILIEQHRADFELLKRHFRSNLWHKDRTIQALGDCRSLLRGVSQVLCPEAYTPERALLIDRASCLNIELLSWASDSGLKLPDN